ncbi:MAG: inositol monophosphatase [Leptolyngbya sp. SIO3F4]|nr:inositol monophosphatase [Leptolyngbya sp. SIO3F4]
MKYFSDVAILAATLAGNRLLQNFRSHKATILGQEVLSVANRSLSKEVTSSNDHEADKIIIDLISERCSDHNLLTEETGLIDRGSPYTWVIDPLDGSSNFLNLNPFFAVSICLTYENMPITGVVFSPFLEEFAVARKGHGCTVNGREVHVSKTNNFANTYVVGCPGGEKHNRRFATLEYALHSQIKDFRKIGSAAVECYMVAAGRVDAFTTLQISPWDVAAGILCVEEAGGRVTDFNGNPWNLEKTDLLVSNNLMHDTILDEIQKSGVVDVSDSATRTLSSAAI